MEGTLVNRVASSGLITINLEDFYPKADFVSFDIKDYLFHGLILKEKDFRTSLKEYNWSSLENKIVLITCSADAIIPMWSYMLIAAYARPIATDVFQGSQEEYVKAHYKNIITKMSAEEYTQKRVVIKGCSDKPVPPQAYTEIVNLLQPVAQSIMFGEPCSTVPVFKRPRVINKS